MIATGHTRTETRAYDELHTREAYGASAFVATQYRSLAAQVAWAAIAGEPQYIPPALCRMKPP